MTEQEHAHLDPRAELVDRLLEYKKYKGTLDDLRRMEEVRAFMNPRGYAEIEMQQAP